ncbi:MAG TPA: hypothetical protein P5550_09235 [Bacteroidales bacterium]|nr:hypothetical protein [Bacteroidales bacterium]HRZ77007.1 hypothetical protein [Bacteroidales bacterium]
MKRTLASLLLLWALALLTGCSEYAFVDCETYDYSDCVTWPAETGSLQVTVNFPDGMERVPVILFRGSYPSSDTVLYDTLTRSAATYTLDIGQFYSMTAQYLVDGQRVLAVDGDEVSQRSYNVCDSVCWVHRDGRLDLRLKFGN